MGEYPIVLVYLRNPNKKMIYEIPILTAESLGISYLAASLRKNGFIVKVVDGSAQGLSNDEVIARILGNDPFLVGFSVTHVTIRDALAIAAECKKSKKHLHVCLGGHHATFSAVDILKKEATIDSIIRGDGEITIVRLAQRLQKNQSLNGISGIYFRKKNGNIYQNRDRKAIENLNLLSFPARDTLEISLQQQKLPLRMASISTTRGCPRNCSFCSTPNFYKLQNAHYWRPRSYENVVEEIQYLYKKYDLDRIFFVDDNFVVNSQASKERARKMAEELIKRKINVLFAILCRVDVFSERDRKLLMLLKEAGFTRILLGVEAAAQPMLDLYNKSINIQRNIQAVHFLSSFNLGLFCSIILFNPYVTLEDLAVNAGFIRELMDINSVGMYNPYHRWLEVYPGIPIYDKIKNDGLLLPNFSHTDAYAYRFVQPQIERLAKNMQSLGDDTVKVDWLVFDVKLTILDILEDRNKINVSSKSDSMNLSTLIEENHSLIRKINHLNYSFFMKNIALAEYGWKELVFRKNKESYLLQINVLSEELKGKYNALCEVLL